LKIGFIFSDGDGVFFCAFHHRLEIFVILAGEHLRSQDDLVGQLVN
jgi:hypothetical protein